MEVSSINATPTPNTGNDLSLLASKFFRDLCCISCTNCRATLKQKERKKERINIRLHLDLKIEKKKIKGFECKVLKIYQILLQEHIIFFDDVGTSSRQGPLYSPLKSKPPVACTKTLYGFEITSIHLIICNPHINEAYIHPMNNFINRENLHFFQLNWKLLKPKTEIQIILLKNCIQMNH